MKNHLLSWSSNVKRCGPFKHKLQEFRWLSPIQFSKFIIPKQKYLLIKSPCHLQHLIIIEGTTFSKNILHTYPQPQINCPHIITRTVPSFLGHFYLQHPYMFISDTSVCPKVYFQFRTFQRSRSYR